MILHQGAEILTGLKSVVQGPSGDTVTFYSTIAAASAVLVAIIGGFLVSRLVALSSEQEAIQRRRSQLTGERAERLVQAAIQELQVKNEARARFFELNAYLFACLLYTSDAADE